MMKTWHGLWKRVLVTFILGILIVSVLLAIKEIVLKPQVKPLGISGASEAEVGEEVIFTVMSSGKPVEGVLVKVDNQTKTTNLDGKVTFILDRPGNYTVKAFKEGYREVFTSIVVLQPKPLEISSPGMIEVGEEATFIVTFENKPVEGAIMKVDNQTKVTGANGTATFVFSNPGDYMVVASKKGYQNASFLVKVTQPLMIPNNDIEIRGLALNPPRDTPIEYVFNKAKEAGANYIIITFWVYSDLSGEIAYCEPAEDRLIQLIREAHSRGFKVWLNIRTPLKEILPSEEGSLLFELNPELFDGLSDEARSNFLKNLKPIILKWAEICENEGVEIFTPVASGQLYLLLLNEEAFTWSNDLLPEVRKVYSGMLVQKIDLNPWTQQLHRAGLTKEVYDFKGWDYVSTDIFGSSDMNGRPIRTYDDWRNYIQDLLNFSLSLNERYKTKGVIFGPEIMVPESEQSTLTAGTDFWGHGELSEEEMEAGKVELFKILFEETYGKVKGYSFWSWMPGFEITYFTVEVEKNGQKYRDRIIPGYQHDGPLNVIKCYYLKDCRYRNLAEDNLTKFMLTFKGDALQAIEDAKSVVNQIRNFSQLLAKEAEDLLLKAEEAYKSGDYLIAKCLAHKVYDMREEINPAGIIIDGLAEDWKERYEPLAMDDVDDVPNDEEDLRSVYLANDEDFLYFMIEYADKPGRDGVVMFLDVDLDGLIDHHIRVYPSEAFLAKAILPSYPAPSEWEQIAYLKCAYGQVIELKVPLEMIGQPSAIRMKIASWSDETNDVSDEMAGFSWITYKMN